MKFQPGQRVRCISTESTFKIKLGEVYTVGGYILNSDTALWLVEIGRDKHFFYHRFVLVDSIEEVEPMSEAEFRRLLSV